MGLLVTESALETVDAEKFEWWTAVLYPAARGDTLDLLNDWTLWAALYDDYTEVHDPGLQGTIIQDLRAILFEDTPVPASAETNPLVRALADLWRRTKEYPMSSRWFARQAKWTYYFLEMLSNEAEYRRDQVWMTLDRFLEYRLWNGFCWGLIHLGLIVHGRDPSERILATPEIRALIRLTSEYGTFVNDVYGYHRDQGWGDNLNTVAILQHDRGYERETAILETISMAAATMRSYLRVRNTVPAMYDELNISPDDRTCTDLFIETMNNWSRTIFDYHLISDRYNQIPPPLDYHRTFWIDKQTGWSDRT